MLKLIKIWVLFVFFVAISCKDKHLCVDSVDFFDLQKRIVKEHKTVVVVAYSKSCNICHDMLQEWEANYRWTQLLKENYLLCLVDIDTSKNIFSSLMNSLASPLVFVITPDKEIEYVYAGFITSEQLKNKLNQIEIQQQDIIWEMGNCAFYTSSVKELRKFLSAILQAILILQTDNSDTSNLKIGLAKVEKSLEIEPYFFNRYLAWKYYSLLGLAQEASNYREQILKYLTDQDRILYVSQLNELMEKQCIENKYNKDKLFLKEYTPVVNGEKKFVIDYKNSFDFPILIKSVDYKCDCLKVTWSKSPLLPGEIGQIIVRYEGRRNEIFLKKIYVFTNISDFPYEILLKGEESNKKATKTIR